MTTITTGTSGPNAWKIALVAGAVGLATIIAANLPQTTSDTPSQPAADTATATLPESVTGFEYNTESTPGRAASPGVTSEYLGNSGELFPYENGSAPPSAVDQATINGLAPVITREYLDGLGAPIRVDPRAAVAAGHDPGAIDAVVGNTSVAPVPVVDLDQMIRDMIAEAQVTPAIAGAASDEALVVPPTAVGNSNRVDPRAAAAAGLSPGAIDAIVGGTTRVAVVPDNLADAQTRAEALAGTNANAEAGTNARWEALAEAYRDGTVSSYITGDPDPVVSLPANANAEAGTNARWGALHEAHHDGTLSAGYTGERIATDNGSPAWQTYLDAVDNGGAGTYFQQTSPSSNTNPADIKFLAGSTVTSGSQRIPQQNVAVR